MAIKVKKGKGILFEAVPDNGQVGMRVGENGRAQYVWPNRMVLPDDILTKLKKDTVPFLYPPPKPIEYQGASWIVNMCADADEYRNALIGLDQAFGDKLPIFNHPRAVAMTRRDLSAKLLDGIPNLIVPKCVRFKADANNSFQKTFEAEGFKYPVLVRPATSQTGRDLVKIDTPFDWVKVYQTHWYGKYHYMTQFVDFQGADGKFTKIRVAFVGDTMFFRGYNPSDTWKIFAAYSDTPTDADLLRYMDKIEEFEKNATLIQVCQEIRRRCGLDFFGIDLGLLDGGRFVLFETNAAMSILRPTIGSADFKIIKPQQDQIERSLRGYMALPAQWQSTEGSSPTVRATFGLEP
ncbi:hypothetical protein PXK48_22410 [Phaeobacter gallaeciensis]|uniref:ATP-grasp domain-containing protein n=2 Tax=Phaeobacter gallaeciensis TaxID=60890 RepID=UPI00237FA91D|nr:hypothetical protein [Phaeobacter gallaeciensis]MDE4063880.1 hypothetical protein [Phaeobacter gallaeciensis]MDE4131376.1 hypothetical protein [Phaeobacter gallaeciensis]